MHHGGRCIAVDLPTEVAFTCCLVGGRFLPPPPLTAVFGCGVSVLAHVTNALLKVLCKTVLSPSLHLLIFCIHAFMHSLAPR